MEEGRIYFHHKLNTMGVFFSKGGDMDINFVNTGEGSLVYWSGLQNTGSHTGSHIVEGIEIDRKSRYWKMVFCHEIAHVLIGYPEEYRSDIAVRFENELLAWRLAKSFCKPELWNEDFALKCLETYRYGNKHRIKEITEIIETNKIN